MNGEMIGLIILAVVGGVYYYSARKKKMTKSTDGNNEKKPKEKLTVQDLFDYKEISSKGISELKNGTFTAIMEVTQINQRLNNDAENASIWRKYRGLLNAIGIRHTELVQSQYLDVADFVNKFDETASNNTLLTPQLLEAKDDVVQSYHDFTEENIREVRSYVLFRFNPHKDGLDKGLVTGNVGLDNLLSSLKSRTNHISDDEAQDLANSMLEEVCDLSYQLLHSLGIKAYRLDKAGVLNMVYMTLNRDLTLSQRLFDASEAHSFTEFKESQTPFLIEKLSEYEELKLEGYNVQYVSEDEINSVPPLDEEDSDFALSTN